MRSLGARGIRVALGVVIAAAIATLASWSSTGRLVEAKLLDRFFALRGVRTPDDVVLVSITEATLEHAKAAYPEGRIGKVVVGKALRRMAQAGARVLAWDGTLERVDTPENEAAFREDLEAIGALVTNCYFAPLVKGSAATRVYHGPPADYGDRVAPGLATVRPDEDAVLRVLKLHETFEGKRYWAFAVRIAALARRLSPEALYQAIPRASFADAAGRDLRLDYLGTRGAVPSIPFHEVLEDDSGVLPKLFKDKIVIVGLDTLDSKTHFDTPFTPEGEPGHSGHEIHANAVHTLLHGGIRHLPGWSRPVLALLLAALGAGLALLSRPLAWRAGAWLAASALLLGGSALAFVQQQAWIPLAAPLLGTAAAFWGLCLASERARSTEQGARRTLALLVIDMCGSTELSNALGNQFATRLKDQLRRVVLSCSEPRGLQFGKGTGDGMLLGFADVRGAAEAALEMLERLREHNAGLASERERIHVRVALHVGEVNVVRVGGQPDIEGEAANMVCRIEGLKRESLVEDAGGMRREELPEQDRILLSEAARDELAPTFPAVRYVGFFDLKGIRGRHRIFSLGGTT